MSLSMAESSNLFVGPNPRNKGPHSAAARRRSAPARCKDFRRAVVERHLTAVQGFGLWAFWGPALTCASELSGRKSEHKKKRAYFLEEDCKTWEKTSQSYLQEN